MTGRPEPDIEVWERRPDESDPAWQAFETYREQEPGKRSLSAVARQLSKSRPLITRWSQRYAWQLRTAAYDREVDRQWRAQTMHLRRQAAEQDERLARAMLSKVVARLNSIDPASLSARDCATWLDVATKVRRLALGEPDQRVEHSGPGGGPIPVEDLSPEERRARLEQLVKEGQRRLQSVPNAG
jgi:hypothetical protein